MDQHRKWPSRGAAMHHYMREAWHIRCYISCDIRARPQSLLSSHFTGPRDGSECCTSRRSRPRMVRRRSLPLLRYGNTITVSVPLRMQIRQRQLFAPPLKCHPLLFKVDSLFRSLRPDWLQSPKFPSPGFHPPTSGSWLFPRPRFLHLLLACGDQVGDVEAERFALGNLLPRGPDGGLGAVQARSTRRIHHWSSACNRDRKSV